MRRLREQNADASDPDGAGAPRGPWQAVRPGVEVELLSEEQELYVLARSRARIDKERAIRQRQLRRLWKRLGELSAMQLSRDQLVMKLGAARAKSPAAWRLVDVTVDPETASFRHALNRTKLRRVRRREGRYLLRTNLCTRDPAELWRFYIQLVEVEAAFKTLKMTWPCARSIINWNGASRRTSSWPSWPTACT